MTKMDSINVNNLLQGLLKLSMRDLVDTIWNRSEEELMERLEMVMTTPDDENRPGLFSLMNIAGLIGTVLVAKYGKDEKELMNILKNSNALFIKEIKNK